MIISCQVMKPHSLLEDSRKLSLSYHQKLAHPVTIPLFHILWGNKGWLTMTIQEIPRLDNQLFSFVLQVKI